MPVSKITPTKENKTMEPVRESTPVTEKASTEKESVSTPRSTSSKDEAATPGKSAKSLGLKQSVEKLSELVLKLQQTVDDLRESNLQKDDRLKALEEKIDSLLKK